MQVTLGSIQSIPEGEGRTFQVGDQQIAVFRSREGGVYATQAQCPHRGGPLADGLLGAGTVICPLHALKFDLRTGRAPGSDCALKLYPVRLDAAGRVLLELDAPECRT